MKRINKTNGTPLGMAFLFLSVLAMPFSLKAVGINVEISPRIGAVVEAWGQIAGTMVLGSHPMNAAEWSFRNASDTAPAPEGADAPEAECSLIASLLSEGCEDQLTPADVPAPTPVEAQEQPGIESFAQSAKATARAPKIRHTASSATIAMAQPATAISISTAVELANDVKKVIAIDPQSLKRFSIEMRITNGAIARAMKEARTLRLAGRSFAAEAPRAALDCDSNKLVHPRRDGEPVERLRRVRTEASETVSEDTPDI